MNLKTRAILVDDIPRYLDTIEKFIIEDSPHVDIIKKATTLDEAEVAIKTLNPDLVFLDIKFEEEGKTSFDLLKKLKDEDQIDFQVIFITAYSKNDYYTQAFEYAALHFITKPIDREELREAISRVKRQEDHNPEDYSGQLGVLFNYIADSLKEKEKEIIIQLLNGKHQLVQVHDILYLKADGKYTWVHLSKGQKLYADKNLGQYARILLEDFKFFRIHHSIVINVDKVHSYNKRAKEIELNDEGRLFSLAASRRMFEEFLVFMKKKEEDGGSSGNGSIKDLLRRLMNR